MEGALKRVKNGRLHLIPASERIARPRHTGMAKLYKQQLEELLRAAAGEVGYIVVHGQLLTIHIE